MSLKVHYHPGIYSLNNTARTAYTMYCIVYNFNLKLLDAFSNRIKNRLILKKIKNLNIFIFVFMYIITGLEAYFLSGQWIEATPCERGRDAPGAEI